MKKTWIFLLLGALCHGCKDKNPSFRLPPDAVAEISVTSLSVDTLWLDTVPASYMIESGVCDDYLYVVDKKLCVLYRYEPTGRLRDKKLGVGHARNETEVGQVYGCCMLDGGGILLSNSSGWYYSYENLTPRLAYSTCNISDSSLSIGPRILSSISTTCTSVPMGIRFIVQYMICGGIIIWKIRGFISTRLLTYGK